LVGWLPMLAGLAMAMSSVTVVGNSILLGKYNPKFAAREGRTKRKARNKGQSTYSDQDFQEAFVLKSRKYNYDLL